MRTSSPERELKRSVTGNRNCLIINKMIGFPQVVGGVEIKM